MLLLPQPNIVLPVNSWFAPIPDRVNMLPWAGTTGYAGTSAGGAWQDPFVTGPDYTFTSSGAGSASFGVWAATHASVTGSQAAPDGTSTAQKIVDDATTNDHFVQVNIARAGNVSQIVRIAFFAKAAEYRRICLKVFLTNNSNYTSISFDLTSLVHSPVVSSGTGVDATNPTIVLFPNGWRRCSVDVDLTTAVSIFPTFLLDNDTGTNAISTNFLGTGAKGVLLWRSNMLPVAAWKLESRVFFDDFNSISTIDINDTRAAGFNWYTHAQWPNQTPDLGWRSATATPSSSISVSGGYLTLINNSNNLQLQTAATNGASGAGAYVGKVFGLPLMSEVKCNVDPTQSPIGSAGWPAFWRWSVEGNTGQAPSRVTESDDVEYFRNNPLSNAQASFHYWTDVSTHTDVLVGYPTQDSLVAYPRPLWASDHRFNVLQITQAANGGTYGIRMIFIDGMYVPGTDIMYGTTTTWNGELGAFSLGDSQHYMFLLDGTPVGAASGFNVDYVAVYQ